MKSTELLKDKTIAVTGGTGSFGREFISQVLTLCQPKKIIVFSRDEKKQHDMRLKFNNPLLDFHIGDVRDREVVFRTLQGVDYVFHAAALKHVPTGEFFPIEVIKTNVLGSQNVLDAAEANQIKKIIVLSTDKSVYPINTMGMTKALMEKLMLAKARISQNTVYCGVRYGNVLFTRGSVLPMFVRQIETNQPLTITHPLMTRYLLPLTQAIDLVLHALETGQNGDVFVRKSAAATLADTAQALSEVLGYHQKIQIMGIRAGEKMHETLLTAEERFSATDQGNYFQINPLNHFDYSNFFTGDFSEKPVPEPYTSQNTQQLTIEAVKKLLRSLPEIQTLLLKHEQHQ